MLAIKSVKKIGLPKFFLYFSLTFGSLRKKRLRSIALAGQKLQKKTSKKIVQTKSEKYKEITKGCEPMAREADVAYLMMASGAQINLQWHFLKSSLSREETYFIKNRF